MCVFYCVKQTNSMCVPSLALGVLCDPSGRVLVSYYQIMHEWWVGEVLVHFGAFPEFSNFPLRATPAIKVWNGKHKNWKKNI